MRIGGIGRRLSCREVRGSRIGDATAVTSRAGLMTTLIPEPWAMHTHSAGADSGGAALVSVMAHVLGGAAARAVVHASQHRWWHGDAKAERPGEQEGQAGA